MPDSQTPTESHDQHAGERIVVAASPIRVVLQILLIVVAAAFGLWTLRRLATLVLVLIASTLFAYVLAPIVQVAERPIRIAGRRRHLPRGIAIAVVYVLIAGGMLAGAELLLPSATAQVDDMIARAPAYAQSIDTWEHGWSRYYARLRIPIQLRHELDQSVSAAGDLALESAHASMLTLVDTVSSLPWLILVPILAFFLLKDATSLRRMIVIALPHRIQLRGHQLFEELNATMAAYIRAQLLACLLVGTVCGLGFAALGVAYPLPLGMLAGILEFIPLVGPLLLAVVASVVAALQAPMVILWVVAFLAGLRLVEDYVVYPRLIRHGIELHPLAVIVAVLAGGELDGVAGVFLAVPAVAVATVVCRHGLKWRGDDAAADVHQEAHT